MKSHSEIIDEIKETFEDWLIYIADEFSVDYNYMNDNWTRVTNELGISKRNILIVKEMDFKIHNNFCEYLTRLGYLVRPISDFTKCKNCNKIIMTENKYNIMKQYKVPIGDKWSENCC